MPQSSPITFALAGTAVQSSLIVAPRGNSDAHVRYYVNFYGNGSVSRYAGHCSIFVHMIVDREPIERRRDDDRRGVLADVCHRLSQSGRDGRALFGDSATALDANRANLDENDNRNDRVSDDGVRELIAGRTVRNCHMTFSIVDEADSEIYTRTAVHPLVYDYNLLEM